MIDELRNALGIRYLKLHITLRMSGRCTLPRHKVSAIRGGMGEMLLRKNCIGGRDCKACGFSRECVVQHIMHSTYVIQPTFVTDGDSVGYVFECHDSRESFQPGDSLDLELLLFGSTIAYACQVMDAIHMLGKAGIGKGHAKYGIERTIDSHGTVVCKDGRMDITQIKPSYVYEYVNSQLDRFQGASGLTVTMKSPLSLKYRRHFLQEFDMEAFCRAIKRRIYMLDCFEGIDALEYYRRGNAPLQLLSQECYMSGVPRYSNRKNERMLLRGLMGRMETAVPDTETLMLLLAGELLHIGKNTSFGFGEYKLQQDKRTEEKKEENFGQ